MKNRGWISGRFLFIMCALAAFAGTGLAQEPSDRIRHPYIRVSGESTVTVKPDQAEISIGVMTMGTTAQAAATQNAQKQEAVIASLRKELGAGAEIKTIGYSVSPNYRYPKEGGQPTISGYTASNVVHVKTNNLALVGKVIDLVTASGANNIQALRFSLQDEAGPRTQALREASTKARAKAEAIASALGLKIQRILKVEEGGAPIRPYMEMADMTARAQAAAPTPIESGTLDVRAAVTITVEIAPL